MKEDRQISLTVILYRGEPVAPYECAIVSIRRDGRTPPFSPTPLPTRASAIRARCSQRTISPFKNRPSASFVAPTGVIGVSLTTRYDHSPTAFFGSVISGNLFVRSVRFPLRHTSYYIKAWRSRSSPACSRDTARPLPFVSPCAIQTQMGRGQLRR